ncbi:hypothetical protein GCM10023257_22930 [Streptomyces hyderabadensis]|uniref:Uncharacterized protein n=1 Tax=Streptomyces hyderabadensis TaxID=598549 RepID=A0ABP9HZN1_9ACTN
MSDEYERQNGPSAPRRDGTRTPSGPTACRAKRDVLGEGRVRRPENGSVA